MDAAKPKLILLALRVLHFLFLVDWVRELHQLPFRNYTTRRLAFNTAPPFLQTHCPLPYDGRISEAMLFSYNSVMATL